MEPAFLVKSFALGSAGEELVLGNLGDSTHGALLDAVAATDASILVDSLSNAVHDVDNALRASVGADAAANALVRINNRMSHFRSLLF